MYLVASFIIISMIFSLKRRLNLSYPQSPIIIISAIIVFFYFNALYISLNLGYFIFFVVGLFSIFENFFFLIKINLISIKKKKGQLYLS